MTQVPVRISATVVDAWGIEASTPFWANADDSKTIAQMETETAAFITALDNTTDGYIKEYRVSLFPALPGGVKTAAVGAGARVEQTGVLNFRGTGTHKREGYNIPAISNGATVLNNSDRISLSGGNPVGILIALLTAVGTVLTWTTAHNQQIVAFIDAIVAFHKKRRQLQRSSFEV